MSHTGTTTPDPVADPKNPADERVGVTPREFGISHPLLPDWQRHVVLALPSGLCPGSSDDCGAFTHDRVRRVARVREILMWPAS
jgi:hypothetical protein